MPISPLADERNSERSTDQYQLIGTSANLLLSLAMRITVILISYQVKFFLEQCLASVRRAAEVSTVPVEVIVVDNAPGDGSLPYLKPLFPEVRFMEPGENLGFGKANNLAWKAAAGEHVVFLNPDTLIPEQFFTESLAFLAQKPEAGALGYRMIDGSGRFLPESKRGFPTAWASFCKMAGFSSIFPQNSLFSGYYQGFLPENEPNPVPVLSGAALWVCREVLEKTGGFDERYFLYAEDIDLSHQISVAGYQNWYLPSPTLIHFKGESSRKSPEYYQHFYGTMSVFVKKYRKSHYPAILAPLLLSMIRLQGLFASFFPKTASKTVKKPENLFKIAKNEPISGLDPGQPICFVPGNALSYAQVIRIWEKLGPSNPCYVQGAGTKSMVGSPDPARPGYSAPLTD